MWRDFFDIYSSCIIASVSYTDFCRFLPTKEEFVGSLPHIDLDTSLTSGALSADTITTWTFLNLDGLVAEEMADQQKKTIAFFGATGGTVGASLALALKAGHYCTARRPTSISVSAPPN